MPDPQRLTEDGEKVVIKMFKDGIPTFKIRDALQEFQDDQVRQGIHGAGNTTIQLKTIEQFLLNNINSMFDPSVVPASTSQTVPGPQVQPPALKWNSIADSFALAAHNKGLPVSKITEVLCCYGYGVTIEEVTGSLIRQGSQVQNMGP